MGQYPKIGLALSGGGARGFYHGGVLAAFKEMNIPISIISGTSAGAISAVIFADGADMLAATEAFPSRLYALARTPRLLFKYRLSPSLMLSSYVSDRLKSENFEELHIPVLLTAVDMETGALQVLDSGPIVPAVMASSSIPGVLSNGDKNYRRYIDGGVLMNLPSPIIRDLCDVLVGINIVPFQKAPNFANFGRLQVLHRMIEISQFHSSKEYESICDFLLSNKEINQYHTFDFSSKFELYKLGLKDGLDLCNTLIQKLDLPS